MSGIGYFGCKRDPIDHRDRKKIYDMVPSSLQYPTVDLRKYVTGIYNQGPLNSCTANAVCGAYRMDVKRESLPVLNPSRLFLYYNTRKIENTVSVDDGATLRDTMKSIHSVGVCKEKIWPYVDIKQRFKERPPQRAYMEARGNIVSEYQRLHQDIDQFRACLQDNCPFVFGFEVFSNFYKTNNPLGIMPMPKPNDTSDGNHAVVAVGYDDRSRYFTILNSWGEDWADKGYFYMPYDFISNSNWCFDFWKVTFASERPPQVQVFTPSTYGLPPPGPPMMPVFK